MRRGNEHDVYLISGGGPFTRRSILRGMEMLRGVRGERETRALIVQENRRYARRQLIWFRKEPNLMWFEGPGERDETREHVEHALAARGVRRRGDLR